jgi:hypothetical protein
MLLDTALRKHVQPRESGNSLSDSGYSLAEESITSLSRHLRHTMWINFLVKLLFLDRLSLSTIATFGGGGFGH